MTSPAAVQSGKPARAAATREIPGLRGWELVKALDQLRRQPNDFLVKLALRFGGITDLPFPIERVVVVSNPEYIEYLLHQNYDNYTKGTGRWNALRELVGRGLLTIDGAEWRTQRQRVQPAFHKDRLTLLEAAILEETERMFGRWRGLADRREPVHLLKEMLELSLRILTRTMFSRDGGDVIEPVLNAFAAAHKFINPFSVANLLNPPRIVRRALSPGFLAFERAFRTLDDVIHRIVRERLASGQDTGDMLSMLIQSKDEERGEVMTSTQVRDEIMTALLAGHEPTAICLTWTLYLLSKHPDVERRVCEEVGAVLGGREPGIEDLAKLEYTGMVLEESLRLYPPVWGIDRYAAAEDVIDGYRIPKGATVAISSYVVHHQPAYWENPEGFDPLRFTPARSEGRPTYAYFPFGGGARRCIGFRFATVQMQATLARIFQEFRLDLVPGQIITPKPILNLPPRQPVWMTLHRRATTAG